MTQHPHPPGDAVDPPQPAPEAADPGAWRRLHPLSPLLRGGLVALVIAGILVANLRDRLINFFIALEFGGSGTGSDGYDGNSDIVDLIVERGLLLVAVLVAIVVIALIILFSWLSWRFHTFRITAEAVEARSGVIFRQHRRAPLERIQSVNLQRPLLARALGLAQLEVQTAGQGGKVALSYLGYRDAQAVREQILRRADTAKHGGADPRGDVASAGAGAAGAGAGTPLADPAAIAATGVAEIDRRLSDFADADIDAEASSGGVLVTVPPGRLIGSILLSWEVIVFAGLAVAAVIAAILGKAVFLTALIPLVIATVGVGFRGFNRGWGFTLSRGADAVRVGAGLTATRTETLPLGRIHAVEARQPLFWRPLGWWQVRVTTAGHTASEGGQGGIANVVLPVGLEPDVLRVIEALLPGAVGERAGETSQLRDALAGSGRGFLGAGPRAGWVLWLARRRAGLRLLTDADAPAEAATLQLRRGALTRTLSVIPVVRMQSVQLRRPLLHRVLGLASLQTHTVLGPVHTELRGLELHRAREAFDLLADTVVRVQAAEHRDEYRAARHGESSATGRGEPPEGRAGEGHPL